MTRWLTVNGTFIFIIIIIIAIGGGIDGFQLAATDRAPLHVATVAGCLATLLTGNGCKFSISNRVKM